MNLFEVLFGARPEPPKKVRVSWRCPVGHDHVEIHTLDGGFALAYFLLSVGQTHVLIENEAAAQDQDMRQAESRTPKPLNAQSLEELIQKVTRGDS